MTEPLHPYATVKRDGYEIPLIGILAADVLVECSLCHDQFRQETMTMAAEGGQMLCVKCSEPNSEVSDRAGDGARS